MFLQSAASAGSVIVIDLPEPKIIGGWPPSEQFTDKLSLFWAKSLNIASVSSFGLRIGVSFNCGITKHIKIV